MQKTKSSKAHSAPPIVPQPIPAAPWRIRRLQVLSAHRLLLEFNDGTAGEVDMGPFLASSKLTGTAFEALRDPKEFAKVYLDFGAPVWPNGANLAPDALHDDLQGKPRFVMPAE